MTGSWVLDAYIIGSIILLAYPAIVYVYREFVKK